MEKKIEIVEIDIDNVEINEEDFAHWSEETEGIGKDIGDDK